MKEAKVDTTNFISTDLLIKQLAILYVNYINLSFNSIILR
jgi:hypothetical protein